MLNSLVCKSAVAIVPKIYDDSEIDETNKRFRNIYNAEI